MPILDPPNILPELGFVTFRVLARHEGSLSWRDLRSRLVPDRLERGQEFAPGDLDSSDIDPTRRNDANDPLNQTIRSLADIGLIRLSDGTLSLDVRPREIGDRRADRREYIRLLTGCVMANSEGHLGKWDSAPGASDLTRSLAFVLLLDPHRPLYFRSGTVHPEISASATDVERKRIDHIGIERDTGQVIHNVERWLPFQRWAVALGFATPIPPPSGASTSQQRLLAIDPTPALRTAIAPFEPASYAADDFLHLICEALPVLPPYGRLFQDVADHWKGRFPIPAGDVPPTLTHAIERLAEHQLISIETGADSPRSARLIVEYESDARAESARQVGRVRVL
jgi:hypothetical protein